MKLTTLILMVMALGASVGWAAESSGTTTPTPVTPYVALGVEATAFVQTDLSARDLMMQEIDLAWKTSQEEVAKLVAQLPGASPEGRPELERRAEARKKAAFAEIYSIQARFARADGRIEDAEALEKIAVQTLSPAVAVTPVPTTSSRSRG